MTVYRIVLEHGVVIKQLMNVVFGMVIDHLVVMNAVYQMAITPLVLMNAAYQMAITPVVQIVQE